MAAPNNAYRNKSLWMRGGTTNYEHKVAILQEDKATMLERFYLDDLVSVKVDGTNDGVIGAVIIGGDNEKMHNITTRGGVGRVMVSGQPARLLNDAGLNTYGKSQSTMITPLSDSADNGTGLAVAPSLKISTREAYYNPCDAIVIEWGTSPGIFTYSNDVTYKYRDLGTKDSDFYAPLSAAGYTPVVGSTIYVRVKHINEEGSRYSNTVSYVIPPPILILSQSTNGYASGAITRFNNGEGRTTVYVDGYGNSGIGTIVSPDENLITNLSSGYWATSTRWYKIGVDFATYGDNRSRILATGASDNLPPGDPGIGLTWTTVTFEHHVISNYVNGCILMDGSVKTPLTIYRNSQTGLYHVSPFNSSSLASEGVSTYCFDGTVKDGIPNKWNFYHLRDGVLSTTPGNCFDGEFPIEPEV